MDISKLEPVEAIEAITAMDNVEQLRIAADSVNVTYSGNTGENTLRNKLIDKMNQQIKDQPQDDQLNFLDGDEPIEDIQVNKEPVKPKGPTLEDMLKMDPNKIEDPLLRRQVVRAKALRLHRVKVTNLDPADAQLSGCILTAVNKYTGKVAKYIPFGDEEAPNGYHIPQILLDQLKSTKFALRRETKGSTYGVKKYKTTMVPKYAIQELPMLSDKELNELSAYQRASHSIDD